jgi:F-type H+-transporting ATPase subunit epsilon
VTTIPVELVSPDRRLWSGEAKFVFARTLSGELGVLPHHIPLMAQLVDKGTVRIDAVDGQQHWFSVDGGFLSVSEDGVTILAESAEPATGSK